MFYKKTSTVILLTSFVSIFSMSASAVTEEKNASASWDVNAVKDSTAGIVITPTSELNFIYNPVTKTWNSQKAPFDLALLAPNKSTSFELKAKIGSANTISKVGEPTLYYEVIPRASSVELNKTDFQSIFEYLPNLSTMTGLVSDGGESASTWFDVALEGEDELHTDGVYKGVLDVDFVASWKKSLLPGS
ncbi:common pilus major fimbrillin subunit EcpA [Aeromonas enteropelogenes]|uniref:common pilus major fimbrillin subunit EcpA n=1 Tax=Aeromonas enteropelogenes TaxID=29489 RepID=UPI003B9FB10A